MTGKKSSFFQWIFSQMYVTNPRHAQSSLRLPGEGWSEGVGCGEGVAWNSTPVQLLMSADLSFMSTRAVSLVVDSLQSLWPVQQDIGHCHRCCCMDPAGLGAHPYQLAKATTMQSHGRWFHLCHTLLGFLSSAKVTTIQIHSRAISQGEPTTLGWVSWRSSSTLLRTKTSFILWLVENLLFYLLSHLVPHFLQHCY